MSRKSSPVPAEPKTKRDEPLLELEKFLPYQLNVVAQNVSRSLLRIYAERFNIGVPEWRLISTLGQYRRMTAKEIGAHSHMHKTKVSRAVASLEEKGLLSRQVNQNDMRESFLTLTRKGERVYQDIVPEAKAFNETLLKELSAKEREQLEKTLTYLTLRSQSMAEK